MLSIKYFLSPIFILVSISSYALSEAEPQAINQAGYQASYQGNNASGNVETNLSTAEELPSIARKTLEDFVEKYQLAIDEIEYQDGAYSQRLTQQLINLGSVYQEYGKHDEAIKILKRSVHLNRVNDGLYSTSQIPIVKKLIRSLKEKKLWDLVANSYSYLNFLYKQNYNGDELEMLGIRMELGHWHLKSYSLSRTPEPLNDLVHAYNSYRKASNIIIKQYTDTDIRRLPALNGLILVNYLIASTSPHIEIVHNATGKKSMAEVALNNSKVVFLKRKSFSTGIALIESEIHIHSNQNTINHKNVVKAKLKLADWYLMYGKRKVATTRYQKAYSYALLNDDNSQFVSKLFNTPVILPDFPNIYNNSKTYLDSENIREDVKYVHASMDITRYGAVKNVKIVESFPEENTGMRSKVLRSLRLSKFRPQIADGNPIFTEQLQLHVFP